MMYISVNVNMLAGKRKFSLVNNVNIANKVIQKKIKYKSPEIEIRNVFYVSKV